MKTYLLLLIILFITTGSIKADDVYLRKGFIIQNCIVKDTVDNRITIIANGQEYFYDIEIVLNIVFKEYDHNKKSEFITKTEARERGFNASQINVSGDVEFKCTPFSNQFS